MLKTTICVVAILAIGTGAAFSMYQEQEQLQGDTRTYMQRKLDDSRDIISGLATEDFDRISKSAQDLMLLSHEADWNVFQTPEYLHMSSEFRSSAQRLRDAANAGNLDGTTLGYFEVTLNCVRCHRYIRAERRRAEREAPRDPGRRGGG